MSFMRANDSFVVLWVRRVVGVLWFGCGAKVGAMMVALLVLGQVPYILFGCSQQPLALTHRRIGARMPRQ
jgi:hypothetical protein